MLACLADAFMRSRKVRGAAELAISGRSYAATGIAAAAEALFMRSRKVRGAELEDAC